MRTVVTYWLYIICRVSTFEVIDVLIHLKIFLGNSIVVVKVVPINLKAPVTVVRIWYYNSALKNQQKIILLFLTLLKLE